MRTAELVVASLLTAAGCGPPAHGPFFGDDRLIVLGVNPDAEADALVTQLAARGLTEAQRIRGETFTALGFAPTATPALQTDVRVVTGRGIALALEARAPSALQDGVRYALAPAPYLDTLDADGDGFDELFAIRTPLPAGERCLLVYRVRDSGFVDAVSTDGYALVRPPEVPHEAWHYPFCPEPTKAKEPSKPTDDEPKAVAPVKPQTAVPADPPRGSHAE